MRRRWQVQTENLRTILGSHEQLDILITEPGAAALVIEHEPLPALNVEEEARDRLGLPPRDHSNPIQASIALRSPAALRQLADTQLGASLRTSADFEYALYRGRWPADAERWPARGWLRGSLQDLALLAQQAMRPSEEIDKLAEILERDIELARRIFTEAYPPDHATIAALFAEHLRLEDGPQTRRMAMAILANALIFQQSLAPRLDGVRTPLQLYNADRLHMLEILQDWDAILRVNYYPIFHVAREILRGIDNTQTAQAILLRLFHIIEQIVRRGAARSHDLVGFVFQRLIADRKFLATFYTRPESAALLAALAIPNDESWSDSETIRNLRIADFACGTGTLLTAVYQRLGALHELNGGDARALHSDMLERVLVGCDVLPMAVHLTLSMLAAAYPEETFRDCTMLAMPYGKQETGEYSLGSLDLLAAQYALPTLSTRPEAVAGHGQRAAQSERHTIADASYDLVIMNPPFTRPTNHAAGHKDIPNPAFAAFSADAESQRALSERSKQLAKDTPANGYAGMASYFLTLADRKLRDGGVLAMVLPLVVLSGMSWEKVRQLLREQYTDITVATIAGAKSRDKAFSADTGLGECLLVARKSAKKSQRRVRFLTLRERPRSELDGLEIARAVNAATNLRRLEDGPFGGIPLQVGEDEIGQLLEYAIPNSGPWQLAGILDFALAQATYQLTLGQYWLPRMEEPLPFPMTTLSQLAEIGPVHRLINGKKRTGEPLGPFDIKMPAVNPVPTYPAIWAHDVKDKERFFERNIEMEADSEAIVRRSDNSAAQAQIDEKAAIIWATATKAHAVTDFQYNSQSLGASSTTVDCIGGRAWPSVIFPEGVRHQWEMAFVVWSNCTLGLLCHWWQANRQQGGRGVTTVSALPALPTLDLRRLSPAQLAAASQIFHDHKQLPMLPVNQIDEDPNRAELDRRLLTEVLGLPGALCESADSPLALLRRKLAAEPSIHGGKISKVVL